MVPSGTMMGNAQSKFRLAYFSSVRKRRVLRLRSARAGVQMAYWPVALRISSTEVSAQGDLVRAVLPQDICEYKRRRSLG